MKSSLTGWARGRRPFGSSSSKPASSSVRPPGRGRQGQARRRRSSGGVCCLGARKSGAGGLLRRGGAGRRRQTAERRRSGCPNRRLPVRPSGPTALPKARCLPFRAECPVRGSHRCETLSVHHHLSLSASAAPVERLNRRSREHRPASIHAPHRCSPLLETVPRGISGQIGLHQPFRTVRSEPVSIVRFALPDSTGPLQ